MWTRQGAPGYVKVMAKQDPERLAAALRDNLKRRKERMRSAQQGGAAPPPVASGADEEGELPGVGDADRPGSWVEIGAKKRP
ncbi:MAG: hypothetical protein ACKVOP_06610 [Sphingomonadaceae bacterium]